MMVRTYGRRKMSTNYQEIDEEFEEDPFEFNDETTISKTTLSFSQFQDYNPQEDPPNFTFSSQDSTRWVNSTSSNYLSSSSSHSPSPSLSLQLLKPRKRGGELNDGRREKKRGGELIRTASLMETQERGEMMECVDEVEFSLDGLRAGKGVRVRRSSLLSLLGVCGNVQQRRVLKAQGMAKTIIDTILDLSLDDSPSNLAAATLFYILTNDGQDSYLLDSSPSIRFLLKLLKPIVPETVPEKAPSISQKLLALRKDMILSQDITKRVDSSSTTIVQKVLETLVTTKDLKASNVENNDVPRPELNPNWISLLTMEKACLSTVSIEDTTGTVRRTGGKFKEKLRQLGGLDAVFKLTMTYHSTLESLIDRDKDSLWKSKDDKLQCLPLLLKCLKIMENATFMSADNQSHLLEMKGNLAAGQGSSLSFVKLMISFIKVLSELTLLKTSSTSSSPELATCLNVSDRFPESFLKAGNKVDNNGVSACSSQECSSSGRYLSDQGLSTSQSSQSLSNSQSSSGVTPRFGVGNCLIEKAASSFSSDFCGFTSKTSNVGAFTNGHSSKTKVVPSKSPFDFDDDMLIDLDDSQDPFAFDEDDYAPSKWEKRGARNRQRRKPKRKPAYVGDDCSSEPMMSQEDCSSQPIFSQADYPSQPMFSQEDYPSQPMSNQEEFGNKELNEVIHILSDTSCSTAIDEENFSLLADCLSTSIKVLMNLTNDNAVGCCQIAACGGLETLSCLISRHFSKFSCSSSSERKLNAYSTGTIFEIESQTDTHLNDHDLDFLVTILGLLVNLVENDSDNRSRLAAAEVPLHNSGRLDEVHTGIIPLLCTIFLVHRGASEVAEEELQSLDDEEVVLQGEKEAEKMIVEAYAALLLAFLSTESESVRKSIANHLPDRSVKVLVPVLERFVTFHLTLNMISPETHKIVSEVIESCRIP